MLIISLRQEDFMKNQPKQTSSKVKDGAFYPGGANKKPPKGIDDSTLEKIAPKAQPAKKK